MGSTDKNVLDLALDCKSVSDELSNALSANSCHQISLAEWMLNSDRDLLECKWEVANITVLNLLRLGILLVVQTFVSSAPIRTVHIDGAHEIAQIIASGSLGWATACIGHTEICASFIEMYG